MVYFAIFAENWKTGPKQRQDFRSDWTATAGQDDDRSLQLGSWCVWALAGDCIERDAAAADLLEDLHIAESDCQARHAANYGHGPTGPGHTSVAERVVAAEDSLVTEITSDESS
jgi:hypothetical protein